MTHQDETAARLPDATTIARQVQAGEATARSFVEQSLQRINAYNGTLNAFIEVRASEALAAADRLDARIAEGYRPGRLAGVPVAVKDSLWEAGIPATNGSRSRADFVPHETLVTVQRLLDEDAIVVGRTNVPEFCYRGNCENELYGRTVNPWDPTRTSGGSSGGAASAVAAGMVPVALGTDGGGSIRIPASFCGIIGFKPSFGVVPRTPGWLGWYNLNHIGPLANSVADAALVMDVIAGIAPEDRASSGIPAAQLGAWDGEASLQGLRVAFSRDLGFIQTDADVQERFERMLTRLEELGVELVEAQPDLPDPVDVWFDLATADNLASEGELLETGKVSAGSAELIEAGREVTGAQYADARNKQHDYSVAWEAFLSQYDFFVTPAMECVAFEADLLQPATIGGVELTGMDEDWCQFMYPFNLTGHPAVSIPMPPAEGELPLGLQILAPRFSDTALMNVAAALIAVLGVASPPELTPAVDVIEGEDGARYAGQVLANGSRVRRVSSVTGTERIVEIDVIQ